MTPDRRTSHERMLDDQIEAELRGESARFEAFQERPVYWDGMRFDRSVTLSRGGDNRDWIQSWKRVTREHASIDAAIAYAKRILAQRPGCPVEIRYTRAGGSRVAIVSRDSLDRVWVDSFSDAGLI